MKKILLFFMLCGTLLLGAWSRWYTQKLKDEFGDAQNVVAMVSNGPNNFIAVIAKNGTIGMTFRFGFYDMGHEMMTIRVKIDSHEPLEFYAMAEGRDVTTARTDETAENWDIMIDQMISGRRFRVVAVDKYGKSRLMDAPLSGFTAAYNQVR